MPTPEQQIQEYTPEQRDLFRDFVSLCTDSHRLRDDNRVESADVSKQDGVRMPKASKASVLDAPEGRPDAHSDDLYQ